MGFFHRVSPIPFFKTIHNYKSFKTFIKSKINYYKVEKFPEPNRFRPVSHPGPCKVMHGKGAYEASRRTAPSESTSIHSSALVRSWRFFGVFFGIVRKSRKFSRTKPVPAGLTPGAVQGYACTRGLRSLAAHRARRIDFYTFKCGPRLGVFLAFFYCFCRGRGRS